MDDLDRLILETYLKTLKSLSPSELRARLARRKSLTRPPRAWCLAIRASDRRINNDTAIITPYRAILSTSAPSSHDVCLTASLIRHLCKPVYLEPNTDWTDAAKSLGVHPESLRHSMNSGRFRLNHYKLLGGKRGHPVPVFLNFETLDPTAGRLRLPTDTVWGNVWLYAADRVPDSFEQPVHRRPVFALYQGTPRFRGYLWVCPKCDRLTRMLYYPLPPYNIPRYFNHDPAQTLPATDTPPSAPGRARLDSTERAEVRPNCGSQPAPAEPPINASSDSSFCLPPSTFSSTFACHHCHRVKFYSRMDRDSWNQFISHVTAGLLYGHEIPKPKDFHAPAHRKRPHRPTLNRPPSQRREQVLDLLLQGHAYDQIAKTLNIGYATVHGHVKYLYKQYDVHSREQLAKKQNHTLPPPQPKNAPPSNTSSTPDSPINKSRTL